MIFFTQRAHVLTAFAFFVRIETRLRQHVYEVLACSVSRFRMRLHGHTDQSTDKNRRKELANDRLGSGERARKGLHGGNVTKAYRRERREAKIRKLGGELFDALRA